MKRALVMMVATLAMLSSAAVCFSQNTTRSGSQALLELNAVQSERNAALERGDLAKVRSFYASHFMIRLGGGRALTLDEIEKLAAAPEILERKHSTIIPKLMGLTPLGSDNIDYISKVLVAQH